MRHPNLNEFDRSHYDYGTRRRTETTHTRRGRSSSRIALVSRRPADSAVDQRVTSNLAVPKSTASGGHHWNSSEAVQSIRWALFEAAEYWDRRVSDRRTYPRCWKRSNLPSEQGRLSGVESQTRPIKSPYTMFTGGTQGVSGTLVTWRYFLIQFRTLL